MSEIDSINLPKTLEEALQEINSLQSQLSGSDLKVFSQNREFRQENKKLKDEIRQLTEQCVSQTFSVRGLEKNEKKLSANLTAAQTKITELETTITELRSSLADMEEQVIGLGGKIEEFQSQEIHLSQELQKTIDESAKALEKLQQEAEEAKRAELERLTKEFEATVGEREKAIQTLENRVEQFKEEFLSQEMTAVSTGMGETPVQAGHAFTSLSTKMEEFLGFPGRALVEQVFRLSGVDQDSTDSSELEETFEVLQDTASQLVRSPEQEKELIALLESVWQEIEMGEGSRPQPTSEAPTEPTVEEAGTVEGVSESEDSSEDISPQLSSAESESHEEPVAELEDPGSEESSEREPSAEATSSEPSLEEEVPEDTAVAALPEDASSLSFQEDSSEPDVPSAGDLEVTQEESAETVSEKKEVTAASAESDSQESEIVESPSDAEPGNNFDQAALYLEQGQHEKGLAIFESLHEKNIEEPTYLVGKIACLAGLNRFAEAYEAGRLLKGKELGETKDVYRDSMELSLAGLAAEAHSDLVKKEYLLELLKLDVESKNLQRYLDEADEIGMRINREGELSLLQAKHRIGQDDVTEYLIDALHSLSDQPEVFKLLKSNLERYPELLPLSEFLDQLLNSPRAESLEAETEVRELLGQGETVEELLDETDPGEEAVVQVFLEHLIPRSEVEFDIPSENFEELLLEAEPAAFVGSLRQALRSVDYTLFFEEIEVLSYEGDEHFLLRSSPEPKPTLLFGAELDDVPPEELRFLVLRELFSMYRRHSQLAHISAGLDDKRRVKLIKACVDVYSEFESKVSEDTLARLKALEQRASEGGQDESFRTELESFLREVYLQTESDSFIELGDFLYGGQLNRKWLDSISDGFAAKQTGMVVASYAICRDQLPEEEFQELEENGFGWLYEQQNIEAYKELRLRLQRLWTTPLKALISEPEE